jgi:phosphatidylglycerophosphatase A
VTFLAAFALFRLFDIWKPAPVRQLERLPGGLGINADDAMAGIYAAVVLYLGGRLLQS